MRVQGVMKALNVNKLTKCGVTFKFWYAQTPEAFQLHAALPGDDAYREGGHRLRHAMAIMWCYVQGGGRLCTDEQQDVWGLEEDPNHWQILCGDLESNWDGKHR